MRRADIGRSQDAGVPRRTEEPPADAERLSSQSLCGPVAEQGGDEQAVLARRLGSLAPPDCPHPRWQGLVTAAVHRSSRRPTTGPAPRVH